MITQNELERIISIASEQELEYLAFQACNYAASHPEMPEEEQVECVCFISMIAIEAELRQVEPLWRKAKRLVLRNSNTLKLVGKIAAGVTIGVFVGDVVSRR